METKNLVSYNQANLLHSIGFDEKCNCYYEGYTLACTCDYNIPDYVYVAPTLEQVKDWLIEKHKLFVELTCQFINDTILWGYRYTNLDTKYVYFSTETFDNHYVALSKGIDKCLNIVGLNHCVNLMEGLVK